MIILCFLIILWLLASPESRNKLTKILLVLVIAVGIEFLISVAVFIFLAIRII